MSRIGNKPITVPEGVEVKIEGCTVTVKGPKGTLSREFSSNMKITLDANVLKVERPNDEPINRSLHGLTRTLLNNMIVGTTSGFERKLDIKSSEDLSFQASASLFILSINLRELSRLSIIDITPATSFSSMLSNEKFFVSTAV